MKPDLVLNGLRLILALTLSFSAPLCPSAVAEIAYVDDIEIEAAAELSREIGWFEAATGKVVKDRIVRRFSLLCTQGSCFLTVVSIPASNCRKADDVAKLKSVGPVLEATQAGSDVDFFKMHKDGSGDLSVSQRGRDSVLIEFTSHEPHQSKNSILVTYKDRFGPTASKVPVKISGSETGVGQEKSLYVAGKEIVNFEYHQLPGLIVCIINIQSR